MPLGYALVDRVARDLGIRCLAIKGPILEAQGLREPKQSVDVDVWVDPVDRDRLREAMESVGWEERIESTTAHVGVFHSFQLAHPWWPGEIDVHDRFPGFLLDPDVVFDALWERRVEVHLAGQSLAAPDVVASAAVAALHHLRSPRRSRASLDALMERLETTLHASQRNELASFAARTGAAEPLREVLERLGVPVPVVAPVPERALEEWRLLTAGAGRHSVAWVHAFRTTPLRRWPGLLRQALLLSEPEIRLLHPDLPEGPLGLWRGRLRRLALGARTLPSAVALVRRQSRSNAPELERVPPRD